MTPRRATRILTAVFLGSSLPFLMVVLFPAQLDRVMDGGSYLVFHNVAEFFSIMVSLSLFGVGWFSYDQSKDRHALFLGTAFLAIGLLDFMHALSSAAMPAFITANSTSKSSQYWIAARLLDSSALLASAFIHPHRPLRWLTKRSLLIAALAICGIVFTSITFFPAHVPNTFVPGVGLTRFKVVSEYLVIALLLLALAAYWRRMESSGDALLVHYMAAFVVGIFGEAAFASYKVDFGTHNVLGHLYKVAAFYLIYRGAFAASVNKPYLQLSEANELLEQRVLERTSRLEAANRELEANRESLRDANEQLREADHRKDEFLGMLSHELRNPLAPIRNSVHVLRHAKPGSEQALRAQGVVERQTQHLTRLVDDLLDVTRVARGKIELRRSRVDLRELVLRAADDLRSLMDERALAFTVAVPATRTWADADPTRVTQIVSNLLHNSAKFTPRGVVELSLCAVGDHAHISVRDTGAGIDAALLPRIFDPFVQGDRTLARSDGGLGLGLALVRGISELHGGSVRVESAGIGKGAEFVVVLPMVGAPVQAIERAGVRHGFSPRRVLVVDDNRDGADSLAEVVKMLGHAAEVAYDGPSALAMASANPPEIVLCDIGLPGMSGYEIAQALRAAGAEMQLYAVSGYAQSEDVRRATEAGFDGHLAKPVDVADIARLLG